MEVLEDFPSAVIQQDEGGTWRVLGLAAANGPTIRIEDVEVRVSAIAPPHVNGGRILPAATRREILRTPAAVSDGIRPGAVRNATAPGGGHSHWGAFGGAENSSSHVSVPAFIARGSGDLPDESNLQTEVWTPVPTPDREMRKFWRIGSRGSMRNLESPASLWRSLKKFLARTAACGSAGLDLPETPSHLAGAEEDLDLAYFVADGGVAAAAAGAVAAVAAAGAAGEASSSSGDRSHDAIGIHALAHHMLEIGEPYVHGMTVRVFEKLSLTESHCHILAQPDGRAWEFLTKLLYVSENGNDAQNEMSREMSWHASNTLAHIAFVEALSWRFSESPATMDGLVQVLIHPGHPLAQQAAASALANLCVWTGGVKAVFNTAGSIDGLVQMLVSPTAVAINQFLHFGQTEAARALLNLAFSEDNKELLQYPTALVVVAQLVEVDDPMIGGRASAALAVMSFGLEKAEMMGGSEAFMAILEVLGRTLDRCQSPAPQGMTLLEIIDMLKMVIFTIANLSGVQHVQLALADFPNLLKGLFSLLDMRGPEEYMEIILDIQEGALNALGDLALALPNRRKILDVGAEHFANLPWLMTQWSNAYVPEYAAWFIANLVNGVELAAVVPAAILLANVPGVLEGLAELLALAEAEPEREQWWERLHHRQVPRFRILNEVVRALANLAQVQEVHTKILEIPELVEGLATVVGKLFWLPVATRVHAARAIANLSLNVRICKSIRFFELVFGSIYLMVACDFVDETARNEMWEHGTLALSGLSVEPVHQGIIASSRPTMASLTEIISRYSGATNVAKERALATISNLAYAAVDTQDAVANFPYLVENLRDLVVPGARDGALPGLALLALRGLTPCL